MNWRVQFQRALVGWIQAPSLVMVVKRFKQMNNWGKEEFQEHMSKLGRLRHLNMLPLVAYYYRKEEKLLAFDYVQKASLAVHLHVPNLKNKEEFPSPVSKQALITYPTIPSLSDQASVSGSKSSSSKQKKKSSSAKKKNSADTQDSASSSKKKSPFDQLKKKDLLQLLKKSIEDNSDSEGSPKESEASSDSDPLMVAYFGHDSEG
ncbi:hypothetical protein I3842_15G141600 [Carya illinoinensis]|uniref:Serine-threonine/tyrosine-protein kinase catalytic domain-containing protein n=1 Tax=Carya illinoinensis TaxID=32201 RepID=A0A922ADS1_CARIL|nr:hypothetical protein I3842_15G141600 [Carya illinoinensis]